VKLLQRIGLADGARADAIPNAAGGEGGHGAAKLDAVIHRYRVNKLACHRNISAPNSGIQFTPFRH
jgi:hypothetical protein